MTRKIIMLGRSMRRTAIAILAWLQLVLPASAGNCLSKAEGFQLASDTVRWTFAIHSGSECLQGLRGGSMLIEEVKVVEPPSAGRLVISGSGFNYKAPAVEANDHFRLQISGEINRIRGSSEVIVDVSVKQ
jgi:hypothetical protein